MQARLWREKEEEIERGRQRGRDTGEGVERERGGTAREFRE